MKKKYFNKNSNYLRIAFAYVILLSALLLEPFNFHKPVRFEKNNVRWLTGTNGVEFSPNGIIYAASPERLHDELVSGDGLTLEVWLASTDDKQGGPARILSYSAGPRLRNFTLGQERQKLIMRLRTSETDLNGMNPDLTVKDVFHADNPQHIVVSYNFSEENVYINGRNRIGAQLPEGKFSNWNPSYTLALGNEVSGNRPWLGKLFLVAIYNRALSEQEIQKNYMAGSVFSAGGHARNDRITDGLVALYRFTKGKGNQVVDRSGLMPSLDLQIPERLEITSDVFLASPYPDFVVLLKQPTYLIDLSRHLILFIPFGFLFHAALSRRYKVSVSVTVVFLLGLLFSIGTESLQYFLESRSSSIADILMNLVGIALGIVVDKSRYIFHKAW